jgi:hypothetical protein
VLGILVDEKEVGPNGEPLRSSHVERGVGDHYSRQEAKRRAIDLRRSQAVEPAAAEPVDDGQVEHRLAGRARQPLNVDADIPLEDFVLGDAMRAEKAKRLTELPFVARAHLATRSRCRRPRRSPLVRI